MKNGKTYWRILAGGTATLFVLNCIVVYRDVSRFPDVDAARVRDLIEKGQLLHCDPHDGRTSSHGLDLAGKSLRQRQDECFSKAGVDTQVLFRSSETPETDRIAFHLSCQLPGFSMRILIDLGRTGGDADCTYSLGETLDQIPSIDESVGPFEVGGPIARILTRLADGHYF